MSCNELKFHKNNSQIGSWPVPILKIVMMGVASESSPSPLFKGLESRLTCVDPSWFEHWAPRTLNYTVHINLFAELWFSHYCNHNVVIPWIILFVTTIYYHPLKALHNSLIGSSPDPIFNRGWCETNKRLLCITIFPSFYLQLIAAVNTPRNLRCVDTTCT